MSIGRFWQLHHRMYLAAFLLDFSVAVGLTAMPFFVVEHLNGGAAFSGTVGAVQMALYAFGCLVSARFVSRAQNGLLWALVGIAVFALLFIAVPWAKTSGSCVLIASMPFLGLALAWPAMQSWLGLEPDPALRSRHLAGFNTATAFGFTVSPLLTGPLYDADFRIPFILLGALCIIVFTLVLSLITPMNSSPGEEADTEKKEGRTIPRGLLHASWAATFTANGLFAIVRSVYPVRVETLANDKALMLFADVRPAFFDTVGPATIYSWLAFLLSLCTVICFAVLGRTRIWQGRYSVLAVPQVIAGASFIILGQTKSLFVMAVCYALVGINFGFCFFASLYYSLEEASQRHRRAAINEGLLGAGGFAGGIGLGYAAELYGITCAFQWTPLLIVLAVLFQVVLLSRPFLSRNLCDKK